MFGQFGSSNKSARQNKRANIGISKESHEDPPSIAGMGSSYYDIPDLHEGGSSVDMEQSELTKHAFLNQKCQLNRY